jgi:hypothetical protein
MLEGWKSVEGGMAPMFYAWSFSEEEIEAIKKQELESVS